MARLFITPREIQFINDLTKEYLKDTVGQKIYYFAISTKKTQIHEVYEEAAVPLLYSLIFSGAQIIDASKMYESIFDRIPLSMVGERWLIENSGTALANRRVYDGLKRTADIIIACGGGIVSLIFYPFVYAAIKMDDDLNRKVERVQECLVLSDDSILLLT
jgi:hypothetical protein